MLYAVCLFPKFKLYMEEVIEWVCDVSVLHGCLFQMLSAKLDAETDADKKDMLTRMKLKVDSSLEHVKSVIDSHGDGMCQDTARMVVYSFFCLICMCYLCFSLSILCQK